MDKLMIEALTTFNDAMGDLIDACADLAELEQREDLPMPVLCGENFTAGSGRAGGAGSWERAMGYQLVLTRFAAARAAADLLPAADG